MTGLYIHVPFCARACPYCDFDFDVGPSPDLDGYLAGLEAEVDARGLEGTRVRTIYIGGGTPSHLGAAALTGLIAWVRARFDTSAVLEWTLEANPEDVDNELAAAVADAGVDRLSLGVQSLRSTTLVQLGRRHGAAQALAAVAAASGAGLRVSADVIVGSPGDRPQGAQHDVGALVDAGAQHLSIYALTVETGAAWPGLVRRGVRSLPDPDVQTDCLCAAETALDAAGLRHYEIASYARPGHESQHNLAYWSWRDYVGLGPSAASARFAADGSVQRRTNRRGFSNWRGEGDLSARMETLDPTASAAEGLWLGLRRLFGFEIDAFLRRFSAVDEAWLRRRCERGLQRGNLDWQNGVLRVAPGRWLFHDDICADLIESRR